jgi:hypothetical protein
MSLAGDTGDGPPGDTPAGLPKEDTGRRKVGTVPTKATIESIKKQQKPNCHLFESVSFE